MNRLIKAAQRRLLTGKARASAENRPTEGAINAPREALPGEYEQVIRRLREIVADQLPPGAQVLVVSRGDDELVRFENREAWHFPRAANGKYAGYHPDNSEDAVEHLKELQHEGARYLLVPAPSFWWLDYYSELFQYLAQRTTMVWDDEFCVLFELERAASELGAAPPPGIARPLKRFLEALLPRGTRVAVLTSGDSRLLAVDGRRALHFPQGSGGRYSGGLDAGEALEQLAELRRKGVGFLVVPRVTPSWLDRYPDFLPEVQGKYGMLARRERVCTVYELNAPPGPAPRAG